MLPFTWSWHTRDICVSFQQSCTDLVACPTLPELLPIRKMLQLTRFVQMRMRTSRLTSPCEFLRVQRRLQVSSLGSLFVPTTASSPRALAELR